MYSQMKRRKTPDSVPIVKGQFSNDHKFYQELTQKLWESHPTDENLEVDIPQLQTKRAQPYLTEENNLVMENRKLKEAIIQMKLEMKSKLEADLLKQKNEFQAILAEYVAFIDKILQDKKELQQQLSELQHYEPEQVQMLQEENNKFMMQSDEFAKKLEQIESLLANLEEEKRIAYEKIDQLKQQSSQQKQYYEDKIAQIKQQHYSDITKFEQIVQEALDKKDTKIAKLKEQLRQFTDQF